MEQFFANMHGLRNAPSDKIEKYWHGEVPLWFSFEIVSLGGELHYFIRTTRKLQRSVEAQLYAQYPDLEIIATHDYMNRFPPSLSGLYAAGYDLWGTELLLEREDCYPIRTYGEFESPNEFEYIDPISALLEALKKIDKRENILIQILARPADNGWQKKADAVVQKLKEGTSVGKKKASISEQEEGAPMMIARTPGETEALKLIEKKITKAGYEVVIRYIYIAERSVFSSTFARRGVISAMNQYSSHSLNSFRHNFKAWTMVKWVYKPFIFPNKRAEGRKQRMYINYRERRMPEETRVGGVYSSSLFLWDFARRTSVLNTEELATVYHFPNETVLTAPLIKRKESKTLGPSAELPIFGGEDDEHFTKLYGNGI